MGNCCIKISLRRNFFYLLQVVIYYYLRKIVLIAINQLYKFHDSLIFTFLMLLGEFFAGVSIHLYQTFFFEKKNNNKKTKYFGINLIRKEYKMKRPDSNYKILLLIFFTAFYDFMEFVIDTFYLPKFANLSQTITLRLSGVVIIFSALLCHFNLRMRILKHQNFSLIGIGICSILIIFFEIFFVGKEMSFGDIFFSYFLVLLFVIFITFTDVVEKYLLEFDFMSPFITLIFESIFGLILVSIYSFGENPFKDVIRLYSECSTGYFILLIFLLFLYFALSAGVNVYKLLSNVLYSPMAKTLAAYILNPFFYCYYYINEDDFISNGKKNFWFFIINVILAIIISFFATVYNEFLVLTFCGLDDETHYQVSMRAITSESINLSLELKELEDNDGDD